MGCEHGKMQGMSKQRFLPDINCFSVVAAVIMLAFALTRWVSFPAQAFSFSVFGILLAFVLDFNTVIIVLTAALAAAGMDWLLQSDPKLKEKQRPFYSLRHWIVPILTTMVIGVALNSFPVEGVWWVIFLLGSVLLMAVMIAEYHVVDVQTDQHPLATVGLTGLSFALYLLLAVAVFASDLRLYVRLPLIALSGMMVVLRSLYLRVGVWHYDWALVVAVMIAELAVGLNYLPISPVQYGLILVGFAYALTSLVSGIKEARQGWSLWLEPVLMLFVLLVISIFWL